MSNNSSGEVKYQLFYKLQRRSLQPDRSLWNLSDVFRIQSGTATTLLFPPCQAPTPKCALLSETTCWPGPDGLSHCLLHLFEESFYFFLGWCLTRLPGGKRWRNFQKTSWRYDQMSGGVSFTTQWWGNHWLTCSAGEAVEPPTELGVSDLPAIRKPSKDAAWMGPKESAVRQHRQELKTKMKTNKVEEVKTARPKQVSRRLLLSDLLYYQVFSPVQVSESSHPLLLVCWQTPWLNSNISGSLSRFRRPLKMWNVVGKVWRKAVLPPSGTALACVVWKLL